MKKLLEGQVTASDWLGCASVLYAPAAEHSRAGSRMRCKWYGRQPHAVLPRTRREPRAGRAVCCACRGTGLCDVEAALPLSTWTQHSLDMTS